MEFKLENLMDILDEIEPLSDLHHVELQPFEHLKLNPDFERYKQLDEMGVMRFYTIRYKSTLIGYAAFFISHHLQYKDSIQAVQDLIFLHPKARKMGYGKDFIDWIDGKLREEGVDIVFHHTKIGKSFSPLLESLGYKKVDEVYGRKL